MAVHIKCKQGTIVTKAVLEIVIRTKKKPDNMWSDGANVFFK